MRERISDPLTIPHFGVEDYLADGINQVLTAAVVARLVARVASRLADLADRDCAVLPQTEYLADSLERVPVPAEIGFGADFAEKQSDYSDHFDPVDSSLAPA